MSLAWSSVKALSIPVGGTARDVKRVAAGGVTVWTKPNPLPYDAEVEYIESTGTQWINTGVAPRNYPSFQADIGVINAVVSNYNLAISFGSQNSWNSGAYAFVLPANSNNRYCMHDAADGATKDRVITSLAAANGRILVEHRNGILSITQGGVPRQFSAPSYENYNELPFTLFRNNSGTQGLIYPGPYRIYGFSLFLSGTKVRDFQPVRVGSGANAVGCLYDRLGTGGQNPDGTARNDGLYYRQGSGAFVVGPDKSS